MHLGVVPDAMLLLEALLLLALVVLADEREVVEGV
jgi:hypothetical protein